MMRRLFTALFAATMVAAPWTAPAADFAEGLRLYDAGDYAGAREEWLPLARDGDADAQVAIAGLYRQGLGLRRNGCEAAAWYRRAAEQGDAIAQINLAEMFDRGEGVERDPARAYFWMSLAADQGHAWARAQRDGLGARLTADERVRGEKLIADWHGRR
jgi:TPR repeat protein